MKPFLHGASSSVHQESQRKTEATWDHYLQRSPYISHYIEAVFSIVKEVHGKHPGHPMEDLILNLAIWEVFMNTTLRAPVHPGKDYDTNLRVVKNYLWQTTGQLFRETEKLISGQTESTCTSQINFQDFWWISTILLHSRVHQYVTVKVCLLRLCAVHKENGRQSCMVFGQWLFQQNESNWWTSYGTRVEDFHTIQHSGNPQ